MDVVAELAAAAAVDPAARVAPGTVDTVFDARFTGIVARARQVRCPRDGAPGA